MFQEHQALPPGKLKQFESTFDFWLSDRRRENPQVAISTQAVPITEAEALAIASQLRAEVCTTPLMHRKRATRLLVLLFCYNSGSRTGDMMNAVASPAPFFKETDNGRKLVVTVSALKTSEVGQQIVIDANKRPGLCAHQNWPIYKQYLGNKYLFTTFSKVDPEKEVKIETNNIVTAWRTAGQRAGLEMKHISGHSFRRAYTCAAADTGRSRLEICEQNHWTPNSRMPDHYAKTKNRSTYNEQQLQPKFLAKHGNSKHLKLK